MKGRRVFSMDELTQPGDYYGPTGEQNANGEVLDKRGVWFLLPIADAADPYERGEYDASKTPEENRAEYQKYRHNGLHRITEPPWVFRECADGSLEIRESIACGRGDSEGEYFHGYLDEGNNWRLV